MSTLSDSRAPDGGAHPRAERIWCDACDTGEHLILDSIGALDPPGTGVVDIAYRCGKCEGIHSHAAEFAEVTAHFRQKGGLSGVLQLGGDYFHCGEAMIPSGSGFRSLYAPISAEHSGAELMEVYLATKVLLCHCGFRMELPA